MLRFIGKVPDLGRIVYDDYDDTIGFCNPRKYNRFLRDILDIVDDLFLSKYSHIIIDENIYQNEQAPNNINEITRQ